MRSGRRILTALFSAVAATAVLFAAPARVTHAQGRVAERSLRMPAVPARARLQLHVLGLTRSGRFGKNQVYNGLGCHGRNLSPALRFTGVPAGTKSLAVTMFDPDAPTQSGWWQWITYDLPGSTRHLAQGAGATGGRKLPRGSRQGRNDFSQVNYGGPCPPVGAPAHRYQLIVWADRVRTLPISGPASAALISLMIERYAIARSTVVVPYGR